MIQQSLCLKHVQIVSSRETGNLTRYDFVLKASSLDDVAVELISLVQQGAKVFINDHRREDSEGGLIFSLKARKIQRMTGGHGYSSDWEAISLHQAETEAKATLSVQMHKAHGGGHIEFPISLKSDKPWWKKWR